MSAAGYDFAADYNFAPTTASEEGVYGAARPGAKHQRCYAEDLRVMPAEVEEWVAFMKAAGIGSVVSMLSASELATYEQPLAQAMAAAFGEGSYVNVDVKAAGADGPAKVMSAIKAARAAGSKVVVHCWGGGGRTGLAQAAWLVTERGMAPEAAAQAVTDFAEQRGVKRRVDAAALAEWLAGGSGQ